MTVHEQIYIAGIFIMNNLKCIKVRMDVILYQFGQWHMLGATPPLAVLQRKAVWSGCR